MGNHDTGYKKLFSHPEMVEDLLRGFVKEDWVQELDFSTLTREFNSYVSEELRERHDDMVWRVRFRDRWLYLYLLLEFQSRLDPWMEKILIHSPFKKPQVQGAKKATGHVLCPALTGCGFATFSICRPGNRIKVEAELFIRESLNFLQRRSNWEFFNGLLARVSYLS
jgi:hypothetical protein